MLFSQRGGDDREHLALSSVIFRGIEDAVLPQCGRKSLAGAFSAAGLSFGVQFWQPIDPIRWRPVSFAL
jgi:hypothetical protein